jgi:hypothetical protein
MSCVISGRLSRGRAVGESGVFADNVGVSVPRDDWAALRARVAPLLDRAGLCVEVDAEDGVLWRQRREEGSGTVKATRRGAVFCLGASGSVCAVLRAVGLFRDYLHAIGQGPHRVTRLDATLDVPGDAAPVVRQVIADGYAGRISLTRKAVLANQVSVHLGMRFDGVESGSVYLGSRHADVQLLVYDKAKERHDKCGTAVPHTARYELKLRSGVGCTLRDCAEPAGVFWHYMPANVLPRPSAAPTWVQGAGGFSIVRGPAPEPAQVLKRRVSESPEVGRLLELAAAVGPRGFDFLVGELRRRYGADPAVV